MALQNDVTPLIDSRLKCLFPSNPDGVRSVINSLLLLHMVEPVNIAQSTSKAGRSERAATCEVSQQADGTASNFTGRALDSGEHTILDARDAIQSLPKQSGQNLQSTSRNALQRSSRGAQHGPCASALVFCREGPSATVAHLSETQPQRSVVRESIRPDVPLPLNTAVRREPWQLELIALQRALSLQLHRRSNTMPWPVHGHALITAARTLYSFSRCTMLHPSDVTRTSVDRAMERAKPRALRPLATAAVQAFLGSRKRSAGYLPGKESVGELLSLLDVMDASYMLWGGHEMSALAAQFLDYASAELLVWLPVMGKYEVSASSALLGNILGAQVCKLPQCVLCLCPACA